MNLQLECQRSCGQRAVVSTTHRTTWAPARKSSKAFFRHCRTYHRFTYLTWSSM